MTIPFIPACHMGDNSYASRVFASDTEILKDLTFCRFLQHDFVKNHPAVFSVFTLCAGDLKSITPNHMASDHLQRAAVLIREK